MKFEDLMKNPEMVCDLTDKSLVDELIEEGRELYEPVRQLISRLIERKRKIEYEEYLANRGIKNYPELNELREQLIEVIGQAEPEDSSYRQDLAEVVIDLDEYLETCRRLGQNFITTQVYKILNKRFVYSRVAYNKIIDFLSEHEIISPIYAYICPRCDEVIMVFYEFPTAEELSEKIYEDYVCDNCMDELEPDLDCVYTLDRYKVKR